jgi:hypothetical protein
MTKSTPTNISSPVTSRKNCPAQLNTISNASSIKTCYTLSKYCNDPNVVNCPNIVNDPNVLNDHNIVNSPTFGNCSQSVVLFFFLHFITTFGSFTTVGQFRTFSSFIWTIYNNLVVYNIKMS